MQYEFTITGAGLQVDKVMILPGSALVLSSPVPAHWSLFGEVKEKAFKVATPAAAVTGEKPRQVGRPKKTA